MTWEAGMAETAMRVPVRIFARHGLDANAREVESGEDQLVPLSLD